jgi:peptide/nickel transport system permease protein
MSIGLVLLVVAIAVSMESLIPGNAAYTILGPSGTPAEYHQLVVQMGLDEPLWGQYWTYLSHVVDGSLGTSTFSGESVAQLIFQRLPVTLSLLAYSILISAVVGGLLGMTSAIRGGIIGRVVDALSLVGFALPNFLVAIVLIVLFAVTLRLLPATGYVSPSQSFTGWIASLTLPAVALSLVGVASVAKQTRDAVSDILSREYIGMLQACGLRRRPLIYRHVLRNAAVPVITILGILVVVNLSGSVFVETVFALPGLGSQLVGATQAHDLPVVEGTALCFAVAVAVVNLLVDLCYGLLNPKIRIAGRADIRD